MLERTHRPQRADKISGDVHDARSHDSAHLHALKYF